MKPCAITIAGAGPTGALLAIFLRRRGFEVTLYERRADPRGHGGESGRSINLALSDRGIHALSAAGVFDRLSRELIPMRGRMIHEHGAVFLQPYGQDARECNHSISRHRLNQVLIDVAVQDCGAKINFEHEIIDVDPARQRTTVTARGGVTGRTTVTARGARTIDIDTPVLFGADGAKSRVRHRLAERGLLRVEDAPLAHAYKELSIPRASHGFPLEPQALHIWPRHDYMLIALPNLDESFTATLFLPRTGEPSFESLQPPGAFQAFFAAEFPDAAALMPEAAREFTAHRTGSLGTIRARPWSCSQTLLIGDAAHAIVPFHGQGLNACFEDCLQLDALLDSHDEWPSLFAAFHEQRLPQTDAIAAMSLENYLEMRAAVADPRYQLQKELSLELERRHPERFIPRYSMVTFHHEIPYALAAARGAAQQSILERLTAEASRLDEVDFEAASRWIHEALAPLAASTDRRGPAVSRASAPRSAG